MSAAHVQCCVAAAIACCLLPVCRSCTVCHSCTVCRSCTSRLDEPSHAPPRRAAVYWDDAELARELVVCPAPYGEEDEWHWSGACTEPRGLSVGLRSRARCPYTRRRPPPARSTEHRRCLFAAACRPRNAPPLGAGSFPIRETEWYFGLRIRHRHQRGRYMNIPVNVTVGPYGGWGGLGWERRPALPCRPACPGRPGGRRGEHAAAVCAGHRGGGGGSGGAPRHPSHASAGAAASLWRLPPPIAVPLLYTCVA